MSKKLKYESCGKQRDNKNKIKLFSCTDGIVDTDLLSCAHIELFFNREINIEGCEGVLEYREDCVKLRLSKGSILLCGSGFDIISFENSHISVKGNITSLEFCI